jgi:hypothetical protein
MALLMVWEGEGEAGLEERGGDRRCGGGERAARETKNEKPKTQRVRSGRAVAAETLGRVHEAVGRAVEDLVDEQRGVGARGRDGSEQQHQGEEADEDAARPPPDLAWPRHGSIRDRTGTTRGERTALTDCSVFWGGRAQRGCGR